MLLQEERSVICAQEEQEGENKMIKKVQLEIGETIIVGFSLGKKFAMVYEGIIDEYHAFMKKSGADSNNISSYRVEKFRKMSNYVIIEEPDKSPIIEIYTPSDESYPEKIRMLEALAQND